MTAVALQVRFLLLVPNPTAHTSNKVWEEQVGNFSYVRGKQGNTVLSRMRVRYET